ncbi:DnaJ domain-containing protein/TPR_1 domain-containing protein/TPR_11 domain-containing protein [Cephalotus follicularis]|uniref:DnaJ domain-containing protein/TPR_1 domain-containing protein/TPR_11 domain-containing protein n=1 Tax=Cephalotus follicularis TaxID=3775 RepID=A0A1Q3BB58_CEPFO|nr:DnaJ domain-containing protein/TPR_1 domain-containing protein/TPR_11 domain-containing protein [Cephalotus follicularis]
MNPPRNSNSDNPNLAFNSPTIPRPSGLSRPRLVKVRKQASSQRLDSSSGFNPFRNVLVEEIKDLRIGSFGDDDSELSKLPENINKLNIKDETVSFKPSDLSHNFTFSSDNNASSLIHDELRNKLNLKDKDVNEVVYRGREKVSVWFADRMKNLSIKESDSVGVKGNENDGSVFSGYVGGEKESMLSNEMGRKLNIGSERDMKSSSSRLFSKNKQNDNVGGTKVQDVGKSFPASFTFEAPMQGKDGGISGQVTLDEPKDDTRVSGVHFQHVGNAFELPSMDNFCFTSKRDGNGADAVEFNTRSSKANLFSGFNKKVEFTAKRESVRDTKAKKTRGKLRQPIPVQLWPGHDFVLKGSGFQENTDAFESYSPMDISPYQETLADTRHSSETSVTSDGSFSLDNRHTLTESSPRVSNDAIDEDLIDATLRMDINGGDAKNSAIQEEGVGAEGHVEDSVSGVETESFKSANEEMDFNIDTTAISGENEASSSSNLERQDSYGRIRFGSLTNSEDVGRSNFTFAAPSAAQTLLSASKRHHRKKNLAKTVDDSHNSTSVKVSYATSSVQFTPFSTASSLLSPGQGKKGDLPSPRQKGGDNSEVIRGQYSDFSTAVAAQEACEKWRLRGNQAYTNGDLSKAEECYTQGVDCISKGETSRSCLRALMLCYSNRAATRMSLGRMRDALSDCKIASAIDSTFLRVQVRAANCYLALGEVEDASQYFRKCLQLGSDICADRKIAVEASDGLQKAQKVSENVQRSSELLKRKTSNDMESALDLIDEALLISSYAEKLIEMKAEALFLLRKYDETIQLCEETCDSAEENALPAVADGHLANLGDSSREYSCRFWRCHLIFKSYFYLGRLEEAIASLEQHEGKWSVKRRSGSKTLESSIPLAATVRELLRHKNAGNESFQAGKHAEAVDHYTAALSCNVESRPFAAICFCNRAAAYKALGQITDAIADCNLAIALDGNYLKAISRRATLFEMIRDYGQAADDLERLVALLSKQVEDKTNQSGEIERSTKWVNDLRQARLRLSEIEEEAKKEIPLDLYLILGVEPSVMASEIKKAYRKAALRHHPDKAGQSLARSDNGDDGLWKEIGEEVHKDADRLFKVIGEAYAILSDPTKRSRYDLEEEMRNAQKKRNGRSTSGTQSDVQNDLHERSGVRRNWREVWRSYGNSPHKGAEATRPNRYS